MPQSPPIPADDSLPGKHAPNRAARFRHPNRTTLRSCRNQRTICPLSRNPRLPVHPVFHPSSTEEPTRNANTLIPGYDQRTGIAVSSRYAGDGLREVQPRSGLKTDPPMSGLARRSPLTCDVSCLALTLSLLSSLGIGGANWRGGLRCPLMRRHLGTRRLERPIP